MLPWKHLSNTPIQIGGHQMYIVCKKYVTVERPSALWKASPQLAIIGLPETSGMSISATMQAFLLLHNSQNS